MYYEIDSPQKKFKLSQKNKINQIIMYTNDMIY